MSAAGPPPANHVCAPQGIRLAPPKDGPDAQVINEQVNYAPHSSKHFCGFMENAFIFPVIA